MIASDILCNLLVANDANLLLSMASAAERLYGQRTFVDRSFFYVSSADALWLPHYQKASIKRV